MVENEFDSNFPYQRHYATAGILTSSVSSMELLFSENGTTSSALLSLHSSRIDFNQVIANSENRFGRIWPTGIFEAT